jgi:hypothetical protein
VLFRSKCIKKERDNSNYLTLDKLEKYYEDKKSRLIIKYKKSDLNQSSIYNDVIQEIADVNFIKEKENFKTLCYDGSDQSLNRFKLADYFWSDLKSRDENNYKSFTSRLALSFEVILTGKLEIKYLIFKVYF